MLSWHLHALSNLKEERFLSESMLNLFPSLNCHNNHTMLIFSLDSIYSKVVLCQIYYMGRHLDWKETIVYSIHILHLQYFGTQVFCIYFFRLEQTFVGSSLIPQKNFADGGCKLECFTHFLGISMMNIMW